MYIKRNQLSEMLLCVLDCLVTIGSFFVAGMLRYKRYRVFYLTTNIPMICLVLVLVCFAAFYLVRMKEQLWERGYLMEFIKLAAYNTVILAAMTMYTFCTKNDSALSRLTLLYLLGVNMTALYLIHTIIKWAKPLFVKSQKNAELLILTDLQRLPEIGQRLAKRSQSLGNVVGVVVLDGDLVALDKAVGDVPIVANQASYLDFAVSHVVDEALVYVSEETRMSQALRDVVYQLELMGVVVQLKIEMIDVGLNDVKRIYRMDDFYVVSYSSRLFDYRKLMLKRLMDIIGGLIGLVFTFIVGLLLYIPLKLDSRGPLLFAQKRVGKNGRVFRMYKFRSMYVDAEARKAELMRQNEMGGPLFKMKDDPRVTRVGRFIRRASLDELPQFFNVLKGDMSLVGTRPPTLDEYAQYDNLQKSRLSFCPGLTGLWQVSGRNEITDFSQILKLDLQYIQEWSILLDIKILLRTVLVVLTRRGAK